MDPWYSSGRFYQALVKVKGWQSGDINDIAQKVQRSGHPEAYRKREPLARAWASVLTGHSPAGLSCVRHDADSASTAVLDDVLKRALGSKATVKRNAKQVVITSPDSTTLWSGVALAMAQSGQVRFSSVEAAGKAWSHDEYAVSPWRDEAPRNGASDTIAVLVLG